MLVFHLQLILWHTISLGGIKPEVKIWNILFTHEIIMFLHLSSYETQAMQGYKLLSSRQFSNIWNTNLYTRSKHPNCVEFPNCSFSQRMILSWFFWHKFSFGCTELENKIRENDVVIHRLSKCSISGVSSSKNVRYPGLIAS